jgi:uncharacterized protein YlzI (FlbEa/FlbD family)
MKILTLTLADNARTTLLLNIEHILYVEGREDSDAIITMDNGDKFKVIESVTDIKNDIKFIQHLEEQNMR